MNTYFFYKLFFKDDCYIGKTKDPKSRLACHRSKSQSSDIPLYSRIRETGGFSNWKFQIIDTLELTDSEARQKEQELVSLNNANLNICKPNGNNYAQSYYQKHKDKLRVIARGKYKKTKKEWKYPKLTKENTKNIHLRKIERTGKRPTALTIEKYEIESSEINQALKFFQKNSGQEIA